MTITRETGQYAHAEAVLRAEKWMQQQGCSVVIRDPFRAGTRNGEQPDAIGWRDGLSILIEVKVSRADFLADKNKHFRIAPSNGMGDWRFYMCPAGMINLDDLPPGWGLLWITPKAIKKIHGWPRNTEWWRDKPFASDKVSETQMLVSALRRLAIRGHLPEIYEGRLDQEVLK